MHSRRLSLLHLTLPVMLFVLAFHIGGNIPGTVLADHPQTLDCTLGRILPSPNPGSTESILRSVVALSSRNVWAVGQYHNDSTNTEQTLVEHWDGMKWSFVPSPNPGPIYDALYGVSAASPTDIWSVGTYNVSSSPIRSLIEHWDGTQWSVVPSPNPGTGANNLLAVTVLTSTNVWAVGNTISTNPFKNDTLVEHWDGKSWSAVKSPNPGKGGYATNILQGVAAASANDIWAVGSSNNFTLTEHWNGTQWSVVSSPNVGTFPNYLNGVAVVSSQDIWAVGYYAAYPGDLAFTLTEHWNGKSWYVSSSQNPSGSLDYFEGVVAISPSDVWTVGDDANSGGSLIEKWDGQNWQVVPSKNQPQVGNALLAVSADTPSDIWTVGFTVKTYQQGFIYRTLIEQYCP